MNRIQKRSEKYRRHHKGSFVREATPSPSHPPSSANVSKCPTPANSLADLIEGQISSSDRNGIYEQTNGSVATLLNPKELLSRLPPQQQQPYSRPEQLPRSISVSFVENGVQQNSNFTGNRGNGNSKGNGNPSQQRHQALRPTKSSATHSNPNSGKSTRRNSVVDQSAIATLPPPRPSSRSFLIGSNVEVAALLPMTPEQLSFHIDYWCRWLFPGAFALFNAIYWSCVMARKAHSETPKW